MSDQLHWVADDLRETWVVDWASAGVDELESFLSKHAAFLAFLESTKSCSPQPPPGSPRAPTPGCTRRSPQPQRFASIRS